MRHYGEKLAAAFSGQTQPTGMLKARAWDLPEPKEEEMPQTDLQTERVQLAVGLRLEARARPSEETGYMCGLMKRRLCVFSSVGVAVHHKLTRCSNSAISRMIAVECSQRIFVIMDQQGTPQ